MQLKKLIPALFLFAASAFGQITYNTITGTVTDSSSTPLAGAQLTAVLVSPTGLAVTSATTPNGGLFNGSPAYTTLDAAGHFSINLMQNGLLHNPGNTKWSITLSAPQDPAIISNQPAWNANYQFTVTGDADLSTQLSSQVTQTISFVNLKTNQSSFVSAAGLPVNNPTYSGALVGPSSAIKTLNGMRFAAQWQTGGGNNGIANALSSGQTVIADPSYPTTEPQPFWGADLYIPQPGPKTGQPQSAVLDYRNGVPQWLFNSSRVITNRANAWPASVMNWTGNPSMNGTFLNVAGPMLFRMNAFMGGNNFYNDKTNIIDMVIQGNKWAQTQFGSGMSHTVQLYGNGDGANQVLENISRGGPNTASDEANEVFRGGSFEGGEVFTATVTAGGHWHGRIDHRDHERADNHQRRTRELREWRSYSLRNPGRGKTRNRHHRSEGL
jgi:hypothetical protein